MVDIQTASIIIAAVAVVVAAVSIIMQNRKAEKARQTQLMMQFMGPLRDFEFLRHYFEILFQWKWTDIDDYRKKYVENYEEYSKVVHVVSFFNTLGLMLKTKIIDLETALKWHPEACLWFWEKVGPVIQEDQKRWIASGQWRMPYKPLEWFEYLYNEMKKAEQPPTSKTAHTPEKAPVLDSETT